MSDDDKDSTAIRVRDVNVVWRTVTIAVIVITSCIGTVIYITQEWTRLLTRVEVVEKWQASKDREAARELWRRDRIEPRHPSTEPKT